MKILLVEDNETIAKALKYALEQENYKVTCAENVKETLQSLNEEIALIILDVSLPDGNGFELYEKNIKKLNIPTIFLTAKDEENDIIKGLELGAEDYITKPFSAKELMVRMKKILLRQKKNTILKVQDKEWEFNIMIHPTGKYAYFMVINRNYILRSDFNGETFTAPYVIAGVNSNKDTYVYQDGVGNQARFGNPYSGVFVKNPEYAGNSDEYDFYLTDRHNHAIRILSPLGQVTTYAGRGSASLNSNPWGYANGRLREDARFNRPKGIAWDERDNTIYVGDANNYRIRKIGLEEDINE